MVRCSSAYEPHLYPRLHELAGKVDLHGLRTTFKTWTNDKTHHAWQAIEAALAHSIGNKVEIRPNFFEKRRPLINDWASFCTGANKKRTKRKHSTRHERQPDQHPFQ